MHTLEVTCVTKNNRVHPSEQITHVGGHNGRGRGWRLTRAEAIAGIINGQMELFVTLGGERAALVVAVNQLGVKYLKSVLDDDEPASLLELPDCTM